MLAGCSRSHELRTADQARRFVVEVARGGKPSEWRLAPAASAAARRAWAQRSTIHDLGARLRHARTAWPCEVVGAAAQIGAPRLTPSDRVAVSDLARRRGATPAQLRPMLVDVQALGNSNLRWLTEVACTSQSYR
jgi:hypothetical protein